MKQLKDLMAAATHRRFSSEQMVNEWLDTQRIRDPETRIAAKLSLAAAGKLATDQAVTLGSLVTDRSQYQTQTPTSETTRLLEKAKLPPSRSYSTAECEEALAKAGFDVEQRIACKMELSSLGLLRR